MIPTTPNLTPEGQRLADALREKLRMTMDYRFGKGWDRDRVIEAVIDRLFEELPAALLLTAPEGEGAGLRANQIALIMSAEASAAWFTEQLNRLDWRPNRADAEAARNAINTAAQAGRHLAALTKQPAAQEPAAAGGPAGAWMQTYSLPFFRPLDPRPEDVRIEDIAHHLSQAVRYGGAGIRWYSVAEHSVHLARAVAPEHALWALLHDASEAYLHDVVRPVKRTLAGYAAAEDRLMLAICERFGLPPTMPPEVKALDNRIVIDERAQNMRSSDIAWTHGGEIEPLGVTLRFWTPEQAEREFLALYTELTGHAVATLTPADPKTPDAGVAPKIEVVRYGKDRHGVSVTFARSEYDSEAHRFEEPLNGFAVVLDVDGTILSVDIEDLKADMTKPVETPDAATGGSVGDVVLREPITDHGEAGASIALRVVQRVCDFDDRTSPEDQPDMLLVTGQELTDLIEEEVSRYWPEPALAQPAPVGEDETGVRAETAGFGDGRRICEALGFDPANHHNALKCPYCNPDGLTFAPQPPKAETPAGAGEPDDEADEEEGNPHLNLASGIEESLQARGYAVLDASDWTLVTAALRSTAPAARPGDEVSGFVLVPREPTPEMIAAGQSAFTMVEGYVDKPARFAPVWRHMIAAAPAADGGRA